MDFARAKFRGRYAWVRYPTLNYNSDRQDSVPKELLWVKH